MAPPRTLGTSCPCLRYATSRYAAARTQHPRLLLLTVAQLDVDQLPRDLQGFITHGSVRDIKPLSVDQSNMPPRKCLEPCIFCIPEPLRSSFASHVIKQSTPIMNVGMLVVPGELVDIVEELIQALELNAEDELQAQAVAKQAEARGEATMNVSFWDDFEKNIDALTKVAREDRQADTRGAVTLFVRTILSPIKEESKDLIINQFEQMSDELDVDLAFSVMDVNFSDDFAKNLPDILDARSATSEGQALPDVLDTFPDVLDPVVPGDVVDILEELIQALELNAEDVASSTSTTFMDVGFWNNFEKNIDDLTKIAEGDRGEIQKEFQKNGVAKKVLR